MTQKCEVRIDGELSSTIETIRTLWELYLDDPDATDEELGNMYEHGLSFDYVAPLTFEDQPEGYFRYQLSWGGPSDEFRIFADKINDWQFSTYRIQYHFMDWFDGAKRILSGKNRELIQEVFESFFVETGTANHELDRAFQEA